MVAGSARRRAHRGARDGDPDGLRHRKGAGGALPREFRRADLVHRDGDAVLHQHADHVDRVRRHRAAAEIFHISRYISVPVALVAVFFFVLRFNNRVVERTFVVLSLVYLTYIASAVLAHPDWKAVAHAAVVPTFDLRTAGWLAMLVGIIGTTISPYMQFFLQSAVVDKGSRVEDLPMARADVMNGSILAIALAGFMIIASAATIYVANQHGAHIAIPQQAGDFAVTLKPLAGPLASLLFAFGILNAGLFTATVLPLSTAYIVCEALGFEAAIDRKFSEAPVFFTLFAAGLVLGAVIVLIPGLPLLRFILFSQVLQGILLAGRARAHADRHQPEERDGRVHEFACRERRSRGRRWS